MAASHGTDCAHVYACIINMYGADCVYHGNKEVNRMKGIRIARLLLAAGMCAVLLAACGTSEEIVLFDDVTSKAADGSSHEAKIEKNEQQEDSVFEIEPELPAEEQEQSMLTREDVWGNTILRRCLTTGRKRYRTQ